MSDHYFTGEPAAADRRTDTVASIFGRNFTFTTASGVFAREGLDKATEILLRASTTPPPGSTVLDLGTGWGPIACALAACSEGTVVHAVDTNSRALALTRLNAERAGVGDRVLTFTPDEAPAPATYDEIWSNPPIRIGKTALHAMLLRWLPHLSTAGTARLVVGKNLGADSLQHWLIDQGWPTTRQVSVKGFRVLLVRRDVEAEE